MCEEGTEERGKTKWGRLLKTVKHRWQRGFGRGGGGKGGFGFAGYHGRAVRYVPLRKGCEGFSARRHDEAIYNYEAMTEAN